MVTVKTDDRGRVKLPGAKPGQVFAYEEAAQGHFSLTLVKPVEKPADKPAKVRIVQRNGRVIGITDRPINMDALNEALKEFP